MQDTVYDKFIELLVSKAKQLIVGDGFKEDTTAGPVISKLQYDKINGYIEVGTKEGATAALGGEKGSGKGYFINPTSK